MRNIITICADGIRRLFSNAISTIIVISLVLLPSIFAWYNILACWDVFGNMGSLTIAVANEDEGYRSDLVPLKINVGEQVLSSLRENEEYNWVFTSSNDAIEGTKEGRYYAAVVIPKSFSRDMLTLDFASGNAADIVYYSNEKKNAIAPKLTGQGADAISHHVNESFARALAEITISLIQSASNNLLADGDLSRVAAVTASIDAIGDRLEQTAHAFELYANLLDSVRLLSEGSAELLGEIQAQARSAGASASSDAEKLASSVEDIASADSLVERSLDTCEEHARKVLEAAEALGDESAIQKANQVLDDIAAIRSGYEQSTATAIDEMRSNAADLQSSVAALADSLSVINDDLIGSVTSTEDKLATASNDVTEMARSMQALAGTLKTAVRDIDSALASGDFETLHELLGSSAEDVAKWLTAPVAMKRTAFFPSDGFGSAMSPFYSVLALFIGQLLTAITLRLRPAEETLKRCRRPKPYQVFLGHFGVFAFIALVQGTLLALGNLLFLQVQAMHPFLYLLCFWVTSLSFACIIYTLSALFANLGKAIGVLVLIAQVTACGGSYPLQILPDFVQVISPWMPATHAVDAMRAAMMGVYQNDIWISLAILAVFGAAFIVFGLLLRRPAQALTHAYLKKVDASKLMNA